jgi:hypothetical protein
VAEVQALAASEPSASASSMKIAESTRDGFMSNLLTADGTRRPHIQSASPHDASLPYLS